MPSRDAPIFCQQTAGYDPEQEMLALSQETLRVILVAKVLAESERPVELAGLQDQVGLLCAKALDLPPGQAGFAKLELRRLVHGIDALSEMMRNDSA